MEPFFFLSLFLFLKDGYVMHPGAEILGHQNLLYHVYYVPDTIMLLDVILFCDKGRLLIGDYLEIDQEVHCSSSSTKALKIS